MEKASIIIPVYNAEKTIEKCINSVLSQDYSNIELIIVDDGSTDTSKIIIEGLCKNDNRIKYIKQKNAGVSKARNTGINNSSGDYIFFVDSDDWLEKDMVSSMISIMKKENVDIVRCNYNDVYDDKIKSGRIYDDVNNKVLFHEDYKKSKLYDHFLTVNEPLKNLVMLLCVKRKLIINNSLFFDEELYMLEDVLYYQKLLNYSNGIYFYNKNLYNYYENPNSVTHSSEKYEKMIFGILESNEKISKYLVEKEILSSDYIKHINGNHFRIIVLYLYYIWKENGKIALTKIINKLYNNQKFNTIMDNYDNYHISNMFNKFFISIVNKQITKLRFLFLLKRIKGGIIGE